MLLVGGRMGDLDFWGRPPAWGEVGQQRWIQIDIEPQNIALNRPVDLALVGDAKATLRALLQAVKARTRPKPENPQLEDARQGQEAWFRNWEEGAHSDAAPIHPLRLMREVREFFPRNAICAVDGGTTAVWAFYMNRIYEPRSFLWAADSGHLGTGVPLLSARRSHARMLRSTASPAMARLALMPWRWRRHGGRARQVIVIIANDRAWGMIKGGQKLVYDERYIGVDLSDARYDKLAEALGCYGERVTEPGQIRPALQRALDSGLPAVLDVAVDVDVHLVPPDLMEVPFYHTKVV